MSNPYKKILNKIDAKTFTKVIRYYQKELGVSWQEIPVEERIDLIMDYLEKNDA